MGYAFDWSVILDGPAWVNAIGLTLAYAAGSIAGGIVLGLGAGLWLLAPRLWQRMPVLAYVQLFRCTPPIVQVIWFYYALPMLLGVRLPAWMAAALGFTLYMGAFSAEIFRAGIGAVDAGQSQAARALGLRWLPTIWLVVLPQGTRRMLPPFVNQCILQVKNTSLLYVIAVPDIMYTSYEITSQTYRPLEAYSFAAALYFAILFPCTILAGVVARRLDRGRVQAAGA